jgi:glycosyltransferase involved in cell wall biosynthesis
MSNNFTVIVSHPARQAVVYHRPMGAERMGISVTFLTGIYYKPERFPYFLARWAPGDKRKALLELLELRRIDGLSPENVATILGPWLECAYRADLLSLHRWWRIWDWLAARWIQLRCRRASGDRPTLIHCFIDCGVRTLRAARSKGMTRLLEVTLPPLLADKAQMAKWGVSEFDFPTDVVSLKKELAEADFVLVQSEFGATTIQALGFPANRIIRVHLGLDTDKFRPRVGNRMPGPLRVIFVGQPSRRKGVHHLIQAWRELHLNDVELLLAGNTKSTPPELLTAIHETPNCKSLGHLRGKDLLSLYQQADILVHPSFAEGGCAAIYEGLGCGVPCIVSNHSTSAVRSGIEGIVFPVGNLAALKCAIFALCADATRRQRMAEAARQRAVQSLSFAAFSRDIAAIYRAVAEISGSGGPDNAVESRLVTAF